MNKWPKIELDFYRILQSTSVSLLDNKLLTVLFSDRELQLDVKGESNQLGFEGV